MNELLDLYLTFFKSGALTFGGGYAMLPILQREVVEKRGWATESEIADYYAIGQCTPGIIAVNTATFIGYKLRGTIGGIIATLGVVSPSMLIITIIAAFISNFAELTVVQNAFAGVRACVCVLILNAILKLWKNAIIDKITFAIFAVIFLISLLTPIPAPVSVVIAGAAGISVELIKAKHLQGGKDGKK